MRKPATIAAVKPTVSAANPPSAMSRRRRTNPTENAAIGPKSGLTAMAPTTIGAESIRTATDAIAPASVNSATSPQLEEPLLGDPLADRVPDDGVGGAPAGEARRLEAARRHRRVEVVDVDDPALRDPHLPQVADDEARLLVRDVAGDDVAGRVDAGVRGRRRAR